MSTSQIIKVMALTAALISLGGCKSITRFPPSPYNAHYNAAFSGVRAPEMLRIRETGVTWTFSRPAEEVWRAVLNAGHQYEGMLDTVEDAGGARRLLMIHGQPMFSRVTSGINAQMVVSKYLDVWIAVGVSPSEDGKQTTVSAAWVSPQTGGPAPLEAITPKEAPSTGWFQSSSDADNKTIVPIRADEFRGGMAGNLDPIVSSLSDERSRVMAALSSSEDSKTQWQYVPRAAINEFFFHVATQLYGPPRWLAKLAPRTGDPQAKQETPKGADGKSDNVVPEAKVEDVAKVVPPPQPQPQTRRVARDIEKVEESTEHARLMLEAGQWTSASLRRSLVVIDAPPVMGVVEDIIKRVKLGADRANQKVTPYIVASPQINAFAVANGDIFITSGLLEAIDSVDELAVVVGHELDHLFQHDSTQFLLNRERAVIQAQVIGVVLGVVGGVAGAAVGAAGVSVSASGAITQSVGSQIASNVVTRAVSTAGQMAGQHVGTTMIGGYSQELELRADRNATRYLWSAGYDVAAVPRVFEKLKAQRAAAEKRNEPVLSGFINANPGLDTRIEKIRDVVKGLGNEK